MQATQGNTTVCGVYSVERESAEGLGVCDPRLIKYSLNSKKYKRRTALVTGCENIRLYFSKNTPHPPRPRALPTPKGTAYHLTFRNAVLKINF